MSETPRFPELTAESNALIEWLDRKLQNGDTTFDYDDLAERLAAIERAALAAPNRTAINAILPALMAHAGIRAITETSLLFGLRAGARALLAAEERDQQQEQGHGQ